MVSNSDVAPNITLYYEWNVNKFQPDMADPSMYDQLGLDGFPGAGKETFDSAVCRRDLTMHLNSLLEQLRKVSAETSEENRS